MLTSSSILLESASRPFLKVPRRTCPNELHVYVVTERFDGFQQARLFVVIFCLGPQVIHVEEVADLSVGGVVPIATLVQEGAYRSKSKTKE